MWWDAWDAWDALFSNPPKNQIMNCRTAKLPIGSLAVRQYVFVIIYRILKKASQASQNDTVFLRSFKKKRLRFYGVIFFIKNGTD